MYARNLGGASRALSGNLRGRSLVDYDGLDRTLRKRGKIKGNKRRGIESIKRLGDMLEIGKMRWATLRVEMVVLVVKVKTWRTSKEVWLKFVIIDTKVSLEMNETH
jgi:hypothetical protein